MNGPEHYREAQGYLARAATELLAAEADAIGAIQGAAGLALAAAQVHATLALTAATVDAIGDTSNLVNNWAPAWTRSAS